MAPPDTELRLSDEGPGGPALCWQRGSGGARMSCALADVLAARARGAALHIAHYPLVKRTGCCSVSEATRCPEPHCLRCESEAEASEWEARIAAALGPRPRRVAVFLNPAGGTGRALSLFNAEVAPLLEAAGVHSTVHTTERQGHATELAASLDLRGLDALLVVSGDGLLSEVYNGLMAHAEREVAAALPLGIIPAGSGNALAKSLAMRAGEACCVLNATLAALCCSAPAPLDAAVVLQPGARPLYALLSLSWALVADVDIESDALRALGPLRFTLQALVRCAVLRRYNGCLLFLPPRGDAAAAAVGRPASAEEVARTQQLRGDFKAAPGDASGWRVLDGPLESVWALNVPWGGEDALAAPDAQMEDGCFDLVVFRGGSSLAVAAALLALEQGEHVSHGCVTVVKATAFALEPGAPRGGGSGGVVVLDGEEVARRRGGAELAMPLQYAPHYVHVQQGAARVLARPACRVAMR